MAQQWFTGTVSLVTAVAWDVDTSAVCVVGGYQLLVQVTITRA
jgi:hypothetical protein